MKKIKQIIQSVIEKFNAIRNRISIDLNEIDNIEFADIDTNDYPDFCDAYIIEADCRGVAMTEDQLIELGDNHQDFTYDKLMDHLF